MMNNISNQSRWMVSLSAGVVFFLLAASPVLAAYSGRVASFKSEDNAIAFVDKMKAKGITAYYEKQDIPGKGTFYRSYVGSYKTPSLAKKALAKLKASGEIDDFYVEKMPEKKIEAAKKKTESLEKKETALKQENKAEAAAAKAEPVQKSEDKTGIAAQKNEPAQKAESKVEASPQTSEPVQKADNNAGITAQQSEPVQKPENKIESAAQKETGAEQKTEITARKNEPARIKENKKEPSIDTSHYYDGIKGIVLKNGKVVRGRIISVDDDVLKIRTRGRKILTYSFTKDVKEYIMNYEP